MSPLYTLRGLATPYTSVSIRTILQPVVLASLAAPPHATHDTHTSPLWSLTPTSTLLLHCSFLFPRPSTWSLPLHLDSQEGPFPPAALFLASSWSLLPTFVIACEGRAKSLPQKWHLVSFWGTLSQQLLDLNLKKTGLDVKLGNVKRSISLLIFWVLPAGEKKKLKFKYFRTKLIRMKLPAPGISSLLWTSITVSYTVQTHVSLRPLWHLAAEKG